MTQQTTQHLSPVQGEPDARGVRPVQFTKVDEFTTMLPEWAIVDKNIVIHFFLTDDMIADRVGGRTPKDDAERAEWGQYLVRSNPAINKYWTELFPSVLEPVVIRVLQARPPRIVAAYTDEVASWWFQAKGFNVLKPDALVRELLTQLDQALDAAGAAAMLTVKTT